MATLRHHEPTVKIISNTIGVECRYNGSVIQENVMPGSSIGDQFRVTTFGESHGAALGCIVDGCPPGIPLTEADIQPDLSSKAGDFKVCYAAQRRGSRQDLVRCVRG